ncbi:MAG: trypsin-like peptidase domain-containing protein [Dehalococcoidia bacterium]|nr:trypsin-like peptidase domain-containing protein [Dehalococcoidia bacterium]
MEEDILSIRPLRKGLARRTAPVIIAGLVLAASAGGAAGSAATLLLVTNHATLTPSSSQMEPAKAAISRQVANSSSEANITTIYKAVSPAVVSVTAVTAPTRSRRSIPQGESGGTGFIVNNQGNILTNYHVVQGATKITITLLDGTTVDATVAGSDPASDLALLKADISKDKIVVAQLGDSDQVEPGEPAIAIGNPFGLDHTITSGVISAINREFGTANGRPMRGLIQTDAPINPGNSGGPLLNADGEIIGITSSIDSPVQGSVGIGFAIPINRAKGLLPQLEQGQQVDHPYLGIGGGAITSAVAQQHNLSVNNGIWVLNVATGGPAEKAGLKGGDPNASVPVGGDIITEVDGKALKDVSELTSYLDTRAVGDTVILTVLRDGKPIKVNVTLGAWPAALQS